MPTYTEINAKSILNKSKIFDYCLNPYTGCRIGCRYCYAALFMRRYSGHKEPWGEFVDIKINAPELLKKQLDRAAKGTIWISSVCDPYQPLEKKYRLTRKCLQILANKEFPVNIQTKSILLLRDLDVLKDIEAIDAGFSITTDNEKTARLFEPGAATIAQRLNALEKLHAAGISTFAFIGPILPGRPEKLVQQLSGTVDKIFIDKMNYPGSVKKFYQKTGFTRELTDVFFQEQRDRLISELIRTNVAYEVLF